MQAPRSVTFPFLPTLITLGLAGYVLATPMSCDNDTAGWFAWLAAIVAFPLAFIWAGSSVGVSFGFARFTSLVTTAAVYLLIGIVVLGIAALTYDLDDNRWVVTIPTFWIGMVAGMAGTIPDCGN